MQIGRLSTVTGVPVRTIRFYEERGIIPEPVRTRSGYRDYDETAVDRLRFLRSAQDAGLTLAEIRSILAVRDSGEAPCRHTRELLKSKSAEVEVRLQELARLQRDLDRLVAVARDMDPRECRPGDICSIIAPRGAPARSGPLPS